MIRGILADILWTVLMLDSVCRGIDYLRAGSAGKRELLGSRPDILQADRVAGRTLPNQAVAGSYFTG
jgi:hypothetical protein